MGEPPIDPPDGDEWCGACGEPIQKYFRLGKYQRYCACSDDNYVEDED